MTITAPASELDARYSAPNARAIDWPQAEAAWATAEVYWLSTVRPDGRPHVTPLISVWLDGAPHFCTGPGERKAKNLETNRQVVITTGANTLHDGLDLVIEGEAVPVRGDGALRRIADAYEEKYGPEWHFDVRNGDFLGDGVAARVFRIEPRTAFGFKKGDYCQTRFRFADGG